MSKHNFWYQIWDVWGLLRDELSPIAIPTRSRFGEEGARRSCSEAVLTPYNTWNTRSAVSRLDSLWFQRNPACKVQSRLWINYVEFRYSVSGESQRTYVICYPIWNFWLRWYFRQKSVLRTNPRFRFVTANGVNFSPGLLENQNRWRKFHIVCHMP